MESSAGRLVEVSLRVAVLPDCPDGLSPAACLRCGSPLDIHQPDANLPDRMLATCDDCKSWHLVECEPGDERIALVLLPDPESFRPFTGGR